MADIRIAKTALKSAVTGASAGSTPKAGPSAFDKIQSKIAEKVAADLKVPPLAKPNPQQVAGIETDLRKRLEQTKATSPGEFFRPQIEQNQAALNKLTTSVNKLPQKSAFDPIRDRLTAIEQQFQRTGNLVGGGKDMDPASLLKAQVQIYQMGENIEVLSKVVDQLSSGAKTVMQTSV
jgi:hypothetical protein